jgi:Primase C terminal 2 (PriCT-2)
LGAWSQQADSYNARDVQSVWKSVNGSGGVTGGTLFHEARVNGWNDDGKHKKPTPEELEVRRRQATERAAKEKARKAREYAEAARKAGEIWKSAMPARDDLPYLLHKRVSPVSTLREIPADEAAEILGYAPKYRDEPLVGRPALQDAVYALHAREPTLAREVSTGSTIAMGCVTRTSLSVAPPCLRRPATRGGGGGRCSLSQSGHSYCHGHR